MISCCVNKLNQEATEIRKFHYRVSSRYCLPTGPPVTFAMDVSPLRILPPAGFIRAPSGSFSMVLVLDKPAESLVDITCSLDVVPSVTQLHSELCFSSTKDKVTFANSTVEIKLNKKDILFQVR